MHKSRSEYRDGYKAHIAIEPETGLVTAATLTPANVVRRQAAVELLADEPPSRGPGRLGLWLGRDAGRAGPREHRQSSNPCRAARVPGGFARDDFVFDHDARHRHLPRRHTVTITPKGNATFGAECRGCALARALHHRTRGRSSNPSAMTSSWSAAREPGEKGRLNEDYRSGGRWSSAPSHGWSPTANRRVRFRGVERNQLGLSFRLAALNLRRLMNLGLTNDGWTLSTA